MKLGGGYVRGSLGRKKVALWVFWCLPNFQWRCALPHKGSYEWVWDVLFSMAPTQTWFISGELWLEGWSMNRAWKHSGTTADLLTASLQVEVPRFQTGFFSFGYASQLFSPQLCLSSISRLALHQHCNSFSNHLCNCGKHFPFNHLSKIEMARKEKEQITTVSAAYAVREMEQRHD